MEFGLGRLKRRSVDVRIGTNVVIKYPEFVSIGDHVAIDVTYITTSLEIGSYVNVGPHCSVDTLVHSASLPRRLHGAADNSTEIRYSGHGLHCSSGGNAWGRRGRW